MVSNTFVGLDENCSQSGQNTRNTLDFLIKLKSKIPLTRWVRVNSIHFPPFWKVFVKYWSLGVRRGTMLPIRPPPYFCYTKIISTRPRLLFRLHQDYFRHAISAMLFLLHQYYFYYANTMFPTPNNTIFTKILLRQDYSLLWQHNFTIVLVKRKCFHYAKTVFVFLQWWQSFFSFWGEYNFFELNEGIYCMARYIMPRLFPLCQDQFH